MNNSPNELTVNTDIPFYYPSRAFLQPFRSFQLVEEFLIRSIEAYGDESDQALYERS